MDLGSGDVRVVELDRPGRAARVVDRELQAGPSPTERGQEDEDQARDRDEEGEGEEPVPLPDDVKRRLVVVAGRRNDQGSIDILMIEGEAPDEAWRLITEDGATAPTENYADYGEEPF